MTFQPINRHVEIAPVEVDSIISSQETTYEEKGVVVSIAQGVQLVSIGQTVYFDSYLTAKYEDNQGKVRYLIPEDKIRAIEYEGALTHGMVISSQGTGGGPTC